MNENIAQVLRLMEAEMTVNDNNGTARNVRPITCSTSKHSSMSSSDPSTCYSSSMTPEQVLEMYKQSQRALTQLQPLTDALLSKGFLTGLYCDITVRALGMDFHLHRLVLVQNPYFHALLLGEWREPMAFKMSDQVLHAADGEICRTTLPPHGPPVLHLKFDDANITVEGLNAVFKRMYGSTATPSFTPETAPQILATALYFNDISLASDASAFMVRTIKYGGVSSHLLVVPYLEFATRGFYSHYSDEIIDAAFTHLCQAGTTSDNAVIESVYLKLRDVKWIEKVLKSDCFFVATKNNGCSSEEERWRFIREVVRRRIQAAKIRLVELERQAAAIVGQWHGSRTHSRSASTLKSQNLGTLTSSSTAATTASEAVLKSPIEQMTPPRSPPPPFSSTSSSTAKVLLPPIKSSSIVSKISPSLSSSCESSSSTVSSSSLAAEAEMVEQEILDIHTEIEQLAQILNTSIKFENLPFGRLASIKHKMERSTRTTTKTTSSSFTDHSASSAVTPLSSMLHLGGIHSEQDQSSLQSIITNMATQLDSITLLLATRPIVESFLDEVTLFKSNWSAQELESRIHMTDTAAAILVPPARVRHNEHSRGRRRPPPPPPSMPTSTSSSPPMSRSSSISSAVSTLDSVHSSSSTFTEFSNTDDCDFNYDYDNDKNDNDDDNYGNEIQDDDYPNIDTDQIDSTTLSSHFASILMNDCDSTIALPYGKKGSLNYFRFSFEFRNVGEMESDKISSGPVYYAGSFWTIYLQKILIEGIAKVGIYLRREVPPSLAGDDQQQAAAASEHLNGKYMDKRINVTAWFKMFVYLVHPEDVNCGVGTDGAGPDPQINNKCYVLESRPDSFRHNQSWGWRSQKLFNDIFSSTRGSNTNVRCCVVMGLV